MYNLYRKIGNDKATCPGNEQHSQIVDLSFYETVARWSEQCVMGISFPECFKHYPFVRVSRVAGKRVKIFAKDGTKTRRLLSVIFVIISYDLIINFLIFLTTPYS